MTSGTPWLNWHDRLHRQLLRDPQWLPKGTTLVLAISGGQDSMALLGLLRDLRRQHHWSLHLWHGDHGWHPGSAQIARDLQHWCLNEQLELSISRADSGVTSTEAKARAWRYAELTYLCRRRQANGDATITVVTGHTANDRAETLLLQLSRGTDLAGLGSLRRQRPLNADSGDAIRLSRPLLGFSRSETAAICQDLHLPVWLDPSNSDPRFDRNRIRQEVLPVLEALHPGCSQRMAGLSERFAHVRDTQQELLELALDALFDGVGLQRKRLEALSAGMRRNLLAHWFQHHQLPSLSAHHLDQLSDALGPSKPPGHRDLPGGWHLRWNRNVVQLQRLDPGGNPNGSGDANRHSQV